MKVIQLANALGAEIRDVDITERLPEEDINSIRHIWHQHHVIVFRDVVWSPDQQLEFAHRFGELDNHAATPNDRLDGYPKLLEELTQLPHEPESHSSERARKLHPHLLQKP